MSTPLQKIEDLLKFVESFSVSGTDEKEDQYRARVLVAGAGGFIGGHLCKRLMNEGYYVIGADWKNHEYMKPEEYLHQFYRVDLRIFKNCMDVTRGVDHVYMLAADMGGMGFIQSNESVLFWNNTMISSKMLEAARRNGVKRYFYSSSACCYNEKKQLDVDNPGLKETDAWPAWPQDTYGLEKLYAEELCIIYGRDFDIVTRMARFHNIYGPIGTWIGGREKAPAAFCRKAVAYDLNDPNANVIKIWGDGKQTRSFCYVDDCVEGILRIMFSGYDKPLNLGSDEMISITGLAKLALSFDGKDESARFEYIKGPEGVRGRNSENTLIKQVLGWAPATPLAVGLRKTYDWIKIKIAEKRAAHPGEELDFMTSKIVTQDESIDSLNILDKILNDF